VDCQENRKLYKTERFFGFFFHDGPLSLPALSISIVDYINTPIPEKPGSYTETRLNSPRGKYSKQHGVRRSEVNLSSDDIPGVSVNEEEIEILTLSQLKFWLKSRRIN